MSFQKNGGPAERFLGDGGDLSVVRGKSDGKEKVRFLVCGSLENLAQKTHGARCMRQRGQSHPVQSGNQKATSDADGFLDVVVLNFSQVPFAVGNDSVVEAEDCNEAGSYLEKVLVPIGP